MASALRGRVVRQVVVTGLICTGLLLVMLPAVTGAVSGDYLGSFGPDGTTNTEFEAPGAVAVDQETGAVYVIDEQKQVLYKFDSTGHPVNFGGSAAYLVGNQITGLAVIPVPGSNQVAVDSETHVIYVTSNNRVRAFESNGQPHTFTEGPGAGTSEIPGATKLMGVATDKYGNIYASDREAKKVRIYSRSGALLTEFTPENEVTTVPLANLAVSPSGILYGINPNGHAFRFEPSQFPISAATTFSRGTEVNAVHAYTVAVDPSTSYVYIGELPPKSTGRVAVYASNNEFIGTIGGPGQPGELGETPVGIAVRGSEKRVYVADAVEIEEGSQQVEMFTAFSFFEGPPTISGSSVTDVTSHSAKLRARINPNTFDTTYWFEYGQVDCAVAPDECTKIPIDGASIGSGQKSSGVGSNRRASAGYQVLLPNRRRKQRKHRGA